MSRARLVALVVVVLLAGLAVAVVALGQDPDRLAARAQEAVDRHDLPGAEGLYRRALAQEPDHVPSLAGIGWTYLLAGQGGGAAGAFERCVEVAGEEPECLRGLAATAAAQGDMPRARATLERAVAVAPDDPGVLSSQALMALAERDTDEAARRYESLVARFPERGEYAMGLAEVRLRQDRTDEALVLVDQALDSPELPLRYEARLRVLHARVLVAHADVAARIDPARCDETAGPLLAWLARADAEVDRAEATGVPLPTLGEARRLVARNRGTIEDACPGVGLDELTAGLRKAGAD
ncbi:MAG: tetratricopeptide repeat protein, partial [Alphaproteobacteria bacterium]|nr:tetratricopeptide repeat protein [Alphaproteobacteria bacterium]